MVNSEQARQDYVSRLNRVLDYIDANLGREMTLNELAAVANFSPYHFHRIFGSMMGEPLYKFIQRTRVEKAASQLYLYPHKSITEIALDCGFGSSAAFARVFKAHFKVSASEWRELGNSKNNQTDGKNRQMDSNDGKDSIEVKVYLDGVTNNLKWSITMTEKSQLKAEVEVKELPDIHVAYVRHTGPYAGDGQLFQMLFGKLFQWAGPRGLINPQQTQTFTLYHDDPNITEERKLRISCCISVPEDTEVSGEIGKTVISGGKYAVSRFELSTDEYSQAWDAVFKGWLPQSGFVPDDKPCFERYLNNPEEHPEKKCIVEICVPVIPM
ncbi:MAG: helix-turn-helix domain-containing protein [candidate division Zixibacteria bacterium]|nr:helix-turn-helix domain-containing protein [candidate division Zixibacteria bacterium]